MKFVIFFIVLYFFVGLVLYISQRGLLYYKTPEVNLPIDSTYFKSGDEKIEVHVVNPGLKKAVIYFGGNAESVGHSIYTIQKSIPLYTLYLVNYRGYGRSSGTPSELGIYEDALAIYDEIKRSHETVSVIGRSLGSGVATYLAVERVLEKVVLVTPYDSIRNVAQKSFPIYPMSILLQDKYESDKRAKDIKIPVLIVIAGRDQVIPNERSLALVKAFDDNRNLIVEEIQAADHNDISTYTKYDEIIKKFLEN